MSSTVAFTNGALIFGCAPLGKHQATGFAKGDTDAIMFTPNNDAVTAETGPDGKMVRSVNADESGRLKVRLSQASPTNKWLNRARLLQRSTTQPWPAISVIYQDASRQDVVTALEGHVVKAPDFGRGSAPSPYEWEIEFESVKILIGDPSVAA